MRTKNQNQKKYSLTIYQARVGLFQLQNNVNHRLQEGCVSAVALGMRQLQEKVFLLCSSFSQYSLYWARDFFPPKGHAA